MLEHSEELAANLFRVTQTQAKIRKESARGQSELERAAFDVGGKARNTMVEISGHTPESLPAAEDTNQVKGKLKVARREFGKLDKPKN